VTNGLAILGGYALLLVLVLVLVACLLRRDPGE
jgi:hypothetical protein